MKWIALAAVVSIAVSLVVVSVGTEAIRSVTTDGEHCGCAAKFCGIPYSTCCSPHTCSMTKDPTCGCCAVSTTTDPGPDFPPSLGR